MTEWQRLSVRRGMKEPVQLTEGFSAPATIALIYWLEGIFGYRGRAVRVQLILDVALATNLRVSTQDYQVTEIKQILSHVGPDDDAMLDVLDAVLHLDHLGESQLERLRQVLRESYSVWTVGIEGRGLVRRVESSVEAAYAAATSFSSAASSELREAWNQLYGVHPNFSDAWDHSIKAMEASLVPIVTPQNGRATLGTVIAELSKPSAKANFDLGSAEDLGRTLRFAWPNPDRHGGSAMRAPEERETAGVVNLAIAVSEWCRLGVISSVTES